jgi:ABC-type sugar transport system substrate-binding protein
MGERSPPGSRTAWVTWDGVHRVQEGQMRSGRRTPVVIRLGAALAICCLVAAWAPTLVAAQEVIGEASFDDISDEWLAWNPETCKFEPADAPGDAYDAIVRTAAEPGRWVFTPEQQQAPFILAMTKDIVDTAAAAGFEVTVLDNAYPDATRPVQVADQAVNLGVDLVISQNVLPDQYPVIQSKYTEACIPMLNIWGMPGPPDPAPQVRAIHGVNGVALANAALGLVEHKGWPTDQIWVVLCGDSLVATEPGSSIDLPEDFAETIQAALGVPDERVSPILECPTGDGNLGAREAVADWLTAHPEAQYVLANSWNDTRATPSSLAATPRSAPSR